MKRTGRLIGFILLILLVFVGWRFFGSNTNFDEDKKSFYIKTGSSFEDVINGLEQDSILKNPGSFALLAKKFNYDKKVKPGRYLISKGSSIFKIFRLLKSGNQTAINLVITKLRTKEDFAAKIASNFECDSINFMAFINSNDSLINYGLDTNTVMTAIIPNTYDIYWNTSAGKIFKKLYYASRHFWNDDRKAKAKALNLTTGDVYTLASIVEEETNNDADKGNIASVYFNRLHAGMKLAADPTIKYALRNFALKRIYTDNIDSSAHSPYNTYVRTGLPPGPICTPSVKTIDAVLDEPSTDYLYFVAKPDGTGLSNFTSSYEQHVINARLYQHYLDSLNIK